MIKQFQSFSSILEKQIQFLSEKGPTLGLFANSENTNPVFIDSSENNNIDNFSFCQKPSLIIKIPFNIDNNIRVFYYYLLYMCYENTESNTKFSQDILLKFKKRVYREDMKFELFRLKDNGSKYKDNLSNCKLKKLLVQFLQIMNYNKIKGSIAKMINKYPIIDSILVKFFRIEVITYNKRQSTSLKQSIDTKLLVEYFYQHFGFEIYFDNEVKEWIFETQNGKNFAFKQGQDFSVFYNFTASAKNIIISQSSIKSREIDISQYIDNEKESDTFINSTNNFINQDNSLTNQSFFETDLLPIQSKINLSKQIEPQEIQNFSFGKKPEPNLNNPKIFEIKLQTDQGQIQNDNENEIDQFKRNRPIKQLYIQHSDILIIPKYNKFQDLQENLCKQSKQDKIIDFSNSNGISNKYQISSNTKQKNLNVLSTEQKFQSNNKNQSNFQKKIIYTNKDTKYPLVKQQNFMTKSIIDFKSINNNIIIQKPLSSKGNNIKSGQYDNKQKLNNNILIVKNSEKSVDFDADSMQVKSSNTQTKRESHKNQRYKLKKKSSFTTLAFKQPSSKSKSKTIVNYKLDKEISQDIQHYINNASKAAIVTNNLSVPNISYSSNKPNTQNEQNKQNIFIPKKIISNFPPLQNLYPKKEIPYQNAKITVNYFKESSNPIPSNHPQKFNLRYYLPPKATNINIKYSTPIIKNIVYKPSSANIFTNSSNNIANNSNNINSIFENLCCDKKNSIDHIKQQLVLSPKHSQFVPSSNKTPSKFRKLSQDQV